MMLKGANFTVKSSEELRALGERAFKALLRTAQLRGESIEYHLTEWYWDLPSNTPMVVCTTVLKAYARYKAEFPDIPT